MSLESRYEHSNFFLWFFTTVLRAALLSATVNFSKRDIVDINAAEDMFRIQDDGR